VCSYGKIKIEPHVGGEMGRKRSSNTIIKTLAVVVLTASQ